MGGNTGRGRRTGSRNKRTIATLALVEDGETPCAYALRVMRDDEQPQDVRLNAARIAAPYFHPKPQPEARMVAFDLPDDIGTPAALAGIHANILRAVAGSTLSVEVARDISAILETHRRTIETVELEERITKLEKAQGK